MLILTPIQSAEFLVPRLVYNRDTGKPKGYGFCEFAGTSIYSLYACRLTSSSPHSLKICTRAAQTIDELDTSLAEYEQRLVKMNESYLTLSERTKELVEARYVPRETAVFYVPPLITSFNVALLLGDQESGHDRSSPGADLGVQLDPVLVFILTEVIISFVAGTIEHSRIATFERVLYCVHVCT